MCIPFSLVLSRKFFFFFLYKYLYKNIYFYSILIIELPGTAYSINSQKLLGVCNLQIKTIEKWTGYNCVPINMKIWSSLPEVEKITYVMHQIKCKCPEIMSTTE